jgi:hypothetical protein
MTNSSFQQVYTMPIFTLQTFLAPILSEYAEGPPLISRGISSFNILASYFAIIST